MKVRGTVTTVSPDRAPAPSRAKRGADAPRPTASQKRVSQNWRALAFEAFDRGAADEPGGVDGGFDDRRQLLLEPAVPGNQIDKAAVHLASPAPGVM